MTANDAEKLPAWLGWMRLAIGLAQGFALYGLTELHRTDAEAWYVAAWVATGLIPVLVVGGLGALRWPTLAVWTVLATALAAGLAWYEVDRGGDGYYPAVYVTIPLLLPKLRRTNDAIAATHSSLFTPHGIITSM